jgi:hypothetical protein
MDRCVKCQSDKIIPDLAVVDRSGHMIQLGVDVFEKPDALAFKGTHSDDFRARVCGACGHVELYLRNAAELYNVYRTAAKRNTLGL